MLYYIEPTSAQRQYSDPTVDFCAKTDRPIGRCKDDVQYDVFLDAIFIIIITFAWAAGVIASLLISMHISGGFLNPGISVALVSLNQLEWSALHMSGHSMSDTVWLSPR